MLWMTSSMQTRSVAANSSSLCSSGLLPPLYFGIPCLALLWHHRGLAVCGGMLLASCRPPWQYPHLQRAGEKRVPQTFPKRPPFAWAVPSTRQLEAPVPLLVGGHLWEVWSKHPPGSAPAFTCGEALPHRPLLTADVAVGKAPDFV